MPGMDNAGDSQAAQTMPGMTGSNATDPHAAHRQEAATPAETPAAPIVIGTPTPATFPLKPQGTPPPPVVERLGEHVPAGITMRDEHGNTVDVLSLLDRPTLILPVFFTCPAACNTLQSSIAATLPRVDMTPIKDFRVITISFDEQDTPAVAARKKADYMAAMNYAFPEAGWIYLTGDKENIKRFMDSLGFPFIRLGQGNFSHPIAVIVTGPEGRIARYMYGQGLLPFDLSMGLNEAADGKTGLSVRRMVSYCFTYDPEARGYVFNFMRVAGAIILFGVAVFLFILLRSGKRKRGASK